jgi:4-hydroxybenzoate polyprenyltransferase
MSPLDPSSVPAAPSVLSYAAAWTQWLLAPILASAISLIYYHAASPTLARSMKLVVSAHGVSMAALYMVAMTIFWTDKAKPMFALPYLCSLLMPAGLIIFSLFKFKGHRVVHWLQLINVACLLWVAFIGIMAVTGDWL